MPAQKVSRIEKYKTVFTINFFRADMPEAYIRCPHNGYMEFVLPAGHRDMFVRIPRPETNVDWFK